MAADILESITLWSGSSIEKSGHELVLPSEELLMPYYKWEPSSLRPVSLYRIPGVVCTGECDLLHDGVPLTRIGNILPGYTEAGIVERTMNNPITTSCPIVTHEAFIFLHNPAGTYGHFLLEMVPKLLVYRSLLELLPSLPILLPTAVPNYVRSWVELLVPNAGRTAVTPHNPVLVENAYCCDMLTTHYFGGSAFRSFINDCLGHADFSAAGETKIMLSRRSHRSRRSDYRCLDNEEEIQLELAKEGFSIVSPELLSIQQQIGIFAQAKIIVGELSSALHNAIFSPAGTKIVQLNPFNPVQRQVALSAGHFLTSLIPDDGQLRGFPPREDLSPQFTISKERILEATRIAA
jgi:O-antigen biosynthesis protein WbqL